MMLPKVLQVILWIGFILIALVTSPIWLPIVIAMGGSGSNAGRTSNLNHMQEHAGQMRDYLFRTRQ